MSSPCSLGVKPTAIAEPVTAASSTTGIDQGLATKPKMAATYQPNKRQATSDKPSGGGQ